jgi:hypothetical protein
VTGFFIRFFSGSGSVPVFGVDRFDDRFGSCNIDVDDLFIIGAEDLIAECKLGLASKFEMSDIGLMHYFLGIGLMHYFLGQGKYAADILSRFQMEDCRPMSTPMITNWKKLSASDSQLVDATVYRQLISSLMYLVNTRPDICCWDSGLWPRLCQGRWSQFSWLHRFRLGRMCC